ncbi:hypothetical protein [Bailinhaonella thermotolerans]|uniref:Uncharacterized protein n=1 Tax=Bailinhaonella thermotolerans TaxID=1070861 RepID=A0A3A4AYR9_9ACTN|nr:hypothetical protein [Bailinhaonella thermotolerans]RJL33529.1 hypothetical protein D5H75_12245 [Bailinhaonella thermotolerans]
MREDEPAVGRSIQHEETEEPVVATHTQEGDPPSELFDLDDMGGPDEGPDAGYESGSGAWGSGERIIDPDDR